MQKSWLSLNITLVLAAIYIVGFFAWNWYLGHFGFFEYDLLQTRYISAGLLILSPLLVVRVLLSFFGRSDAQPCLSFSKFWYYGLLIFAFLCSLFLFKLFPHIPQYWGGARPQVVSLIVSSSSASQLKEMGVSFASSFETSKECKIYENRDVILIGFTDINLSEDQNSINTHPNRLLILRRENLEAVSVLPQGVQWQDAGTNYMLGCVPFRAMYGINEPQLKFVVSTTTNQ